ncbi:hypothetical protein B7486_67515, partial [cyanobacterium TDX16]
DPDGGVAGDVLFASDEVELTSSTVEANTTVDGYVAHAGGRMVVTDSTISTNGPQTAALLGEAGLDVTDSDLHDNTGILGPATSGCDLVLDGVTVTGNHATQLAGVGGSEGTTYLIDSTLSGNSSDGDSGAIVASAISATGSAVTENVAAGDGGGLLVDIEHKDRPDDCAPQPLLPSVAEGTTLLDESAVQGNVAGGDGGGVRTLHLEAEGSTIAGNEAVGHGGGLAVDLVTSVRNSTVTSNRAHTGGGIATFG